MLPVCSLGLQATSIGWDAGFRERTFTPPVYLAFAIIAVCSGVSRQPKTRRQSPENPLAAAISALLSGVSSIALWSVPTALPRGYPLISSQTLGCSCVAVSPGPGDCHSGYQLWDIDTLINKTLVYGLLTALLAAIYAGLIIGLQNLASLITDKASNQPVALVISTLVIAALFYPLRKRIQAVIDRRFYRRKYDAEKTLAGFSAMLRNEVDLNRVREQFIAVVQATVQPAQISLWLRTPNAQTHQQAWQRGERVLEPPAREHPAQPPALTTARSVPLDAVGRNLPAPGGLQAFTRWVTGTVFGGSSRTVPTHEKEEAGGLGQNGGNKWSQRQQSAARKPKPAGRTS